MDDDEREFQRVVNEGLVPKLEGSNLCVALCPDEDSGLDAKFCVELGAMIMLDKPIIAVVGPGRTVPAKLLLVADKIVHAEIVTPEGEALLREAIGDLMREKGLQP